MGHSFARTRSATDRPISSDAVAAGDGPGAGDEFDNIVYNYSLTTGTRAEILAAVGNQANWNGSNSIIGSLTGSPSISSFTVLAPVPEPSGFLFGSLVAGVVGATARRRRRRAR